MTERAGSHSELVGEVNRIRQSLAAFNRRDATGALARFNEGQAREAAGLVS